MKIAVKDLLPNPFRHPERLPAIAEKIEKLKRSINDTGFWDNLICREALNNPGKYELAYGYHRFLALQELQIKSIDIKVVDLDDTMMAQIMVRENMDEFGNNALADQETVRAVVQGYADGRINLGTYPKDTSNNRLRLAPGFRLLTVESVSKNTTTGYGRAHAPDHTQVVSSNTNTTVERYYTAGMLLRFLDWNETKVKQVLRALVALEDDILPSDKMQYISSNKLKEVLEETNRVERLYGNRDFTKDVAKLLIEGMIYDSQYSDKKEEKEIKLGRSLTSLELNNLNKPTIPVTKVRDWVQNFEKENRAKYKLNLRNYSSGGYEKNNKTIPPDINEFAETLCNRILDIFNISQDKGLLNQIKAVMDFKEHIDPFIRRELAANFGVIAKTCKHYESKLLKGLETTKSTDTTKLQLTNQKPIIN